MPLNEEAALGEYPHREGQDGDENLSSTLGVAPAQSASSRKGHQRERDAKAKGPNERPDPDTLGGDVGEPDQGCVQGDGLNRYEFDDLLPEFVGDIRWRAELLTDYWRFAITVDIPAPGDCYGLPPYGAVVALCGPRTSSACRDLAATHDPPPMRLECKRRSTSTVATRSPLRDHLAGRAVAERVHNGLATVSLDK
jgi:hypothetical protein